jgi:hypothetical protein
MKTMKKLTIAATFLLVGAVMIATAQSKLRDSVTLEWTEGSQVEMIDLFKVYSRTNLDGVGLVPSQLRYTYTLEPGIVPEMSEWTLEAELVPGDLVRTNVGRQRLDGTWVTNNVFRHTFPVEPGIKFFVVTSSNFWGESDFFEVIRTPSTPSPEQDLSIR